MSKIHKKTGNTCLICDEKSELITIHKTRRQTHVLCYHCFENYTQPFLNIMFDNLRRNIRRNIQMVKCPGSYHSALRNQCCHKFDITKLVIPEKLNIHTNIFRIKYILECPNTFLCPNKDCGNIVEVDIHYPGNNISCVICETNWCRQCLISPYHKNKSCLEHELAEQKGDNAKFILDMQAQNKLKLCPCCKSPIYRDGGCNKMACVSCGTKWCWICKKANITYTHFNSDNTCSGRLWEGVDTNI